MPHYTRLPEQLREEIAGGGRWVLLAVSERGHLGLVGLAAGLLGKWALLGVNGEPLLSYGLVDFLNLPTLHRATFSILTVPKVACSVEELNEWLAGVGAGVVTEGKDLITLSEAREGSREWETVVAFIASVEKGAGQVGWPEDN